MGARKTAETKRRTEPFRGRFSVWAKDHDEAVTIMALVADAVIDAEDGLLFSWSLD